MKIVALIDEAYKKWKYKEFVFEKINDKYVGITYGDFINKSKKLGRRLINDGFKNKRILLIGKNSKEYMISDLAVLAYVGVCVNVNAQTTEIELKEIIDSMGINLVIYDEDLRITIDKVKNETNDIKFLCMQEIIDHSNSEYEGEAFEEKDEDVCSKIIFSSGTTSMPKGIMLSVRNIFSGWNSLIKRAPFTENEVIYLFLPLHHTYADIYNFLFSFLSGFQIYLASSIENIGKELLEVIPTIFSAVPLIYIKIFIAAGDKLKYAFGNRIDYLFCGGAFFDREIKKYYKDVGLPIMEAYALTETSSSFAIEYKNSDDLESSGTIFEDIDVKIDNPNEDGVGDIVVKGENVFIGYVNNENLTKKVFNKDGYFITGDLGCIIENRLHLKGRKDTVLIGDNGENVYPKEIENKLKLLSENILKVKCFFKEGKLTCNIYVKPECDINIIEIIDKYNEQVVKKDKIYNYFIKEGIGTELK